MKVTNMDNGILGTIFLLSDCAIILYYTIVPTNLTYAFLLDGSLPPIQNIPSVEATTPTIVSHHCK